MKTLLQLLCFVLVSQGAGGLLHEVTDGWWTPWTVVHRVGFLHGYEVYVGVLLIVLGLALGAASGTAGQRRPGRARSRGRGRPDGAAARRGPWRRR